MTVSAEVPASYRTRWNSNTANAVTPSSSGLLVDSPRSNDAPASTLRKLNASCVNCRRLRVKCTGGHPCKRCATSPHSLDCQYGVSRRRGKRKAVDDVRSIEPTQTRAPDRAIASDNGSVFNQIAPFDLNLQDGPGHVWSGFDYTGIDVDSLGQPSLMLDPNEVDFASSPSLTDFLNTLEPLEMPPGPVREDKGACLDGCFISVHAVTNKLAAARNATETTPFDKIIGLLDESVTHASKYLACTACDAGCPRLMTLSLLHQRQIDSLADITKDPKLCFSNRNPRVSFGEYTPPAEDDLNCKRVVLLRVARDIGQSLNSFHDGGKDFEDRYIAGTLELGEAGKLNMEWLLSIAVTLKRRIDCVRVLLQKPDWAANV